MRNLIATERQEQIALVSWAKLHPICRDYLLAIPNGGSRQNAREGANFKREGVRAGVSDLFLAYPKGSYHGLWIEMKRRGKTKCSISKQQVEWLERMFSVKYSVQICYGWEQARDAILVYLEEI